MAGETGMQPNSTRWATLSSELLVSQGIDQAVADVTANYAAQRSTVETGMESALAVIASSEAVIAQEKEKINAATDEIRALKGQLQAQYQRDGGFLAELVLTYAASSTDEVMVQRARLATTIKKFNERIVESPGQPVIHSKYGCNGTDFILRSARASGEPLRLESRNISGSTHRMMVVPSAQQHTVTMPVSPQEGMRSTSMPDSLVDYFPSYRSQFYSEPSVIDSLAESTNRRSILRAEDLWVTGEDTIMELARLFATMEENLLNPWNMRRTRLDAAVHSDLLALRRATQLIGVDIEEIPEVEERLNDWRHLANNWAEGNTSAEVDSEAVAELQDDGFRAQSRRVLINFLQDELAA